MEDITLPETNIDLENRPLGNGNSYWKPPFLGATLVLGRVYCFQVGPTIILGRYLQKPRPWEISYFRSPPSYTYIMHILPPQKKSPQRWISYMIVYMYIPIYIYISPQMDNLQLPRIQNVQSCRAVKVAKWLRKNPDASPHSLQCPRIRPRCFFIDPTPGHNKMVGVVWGKRRSISYMKSRCVFFKFGLFPFIQSRRSLSVKQGKLATASSSCKKNRELGTRYNTPFFSSSLNMNLRHLISSTSRSMRICFFGWSLMLSP